MYSKFCAHEFRCKETLLWLICWVNMEVFVSFHGLTLDPISLIVTKVNSLKTYFDLADNFSCQLFQK